MLRLLWVGLLPLLEFTVLSSTGKQHNRNKTPFKTTTKLAEQQPQKQTHAPKPPTTAAWQLKVLGKPHRNTVQVVGSIHHNQTTGPRKTAGKKFLRASGHTSEAENMVELKLHQNFHRLQATDRGLVWHPQG